MTPEQCFGCVYRSGMPTLSGDHWCARYADECTPAYDECAGEGYEERGDRGEEIL